MVFYLNILDHPVVLCNLYLEQYQYYYYILMSNSTVSQWLRSNAGGKVTDWLKNYVASQQPGKVVFGII